MEIMIIMLRKEKQHGQEFDVMHTHEHCFLQLSSESRDCTQIRAWRSNMLLRLMWPQQTTQDVDAVGAQSAISSQGVAQKLLLLVAIQTSSLWLPSFFNSTISFIDFCPWKARSSLFPDEMSQESNMSSCRGFAAVSRHLVARLSEHVRERGPHGSCRSVIAATKTFYLVPGTNSRRCP